MNRWSIMNYIMVLTTVTTIHAINITGKVTGSDGNAVRGATVALVNNGLTATTNRNGDYTLSDGQVGIVPRQMVPSVEALTMEKSIVHFSITQKTPVKIELFDVRGNLLRRILNHTLPAGDYRYDIGTDPLTTRMLAVRVQMGRQGTTFRYMPMKNGYSAQSFMNTAGTTANGPLAKITATLDSIRVEADGFMTKSVAVDTLFGEVNITLEPEVSDLPEFSFFVTSLAALQELSGSEDGFGGDFRFGHTGPGAGLKGADSICECIAERSMPGSKVKQWRAFLSVSADENGNQVNAIDRIGDGPWYDRVGRLLAPTKQDLINTRPQNGDPAIRDDLPNEDGIPNHRPDPNLPEVDNHHTVTGSNEQGQLYSANATCNDWTSANDNSGRPRAGFSWPRGMGGGGMGSHWMSGFDAGGCLPGIHITSDFGGPNNIIGTGGGYGGFYCFALNP